MDRAQDDYAKFQFRSQLLTLAARIRGTSISAVRRRCVFMLMAEFGWTPREISALNLSDFNRRKGTLKSQTLSPVLLASLALYVKMRPPRANGLFVLVGSSGSYRRLSPDLINQMVAYSMFHSPKRGKVLA